MSDQHPTHAEPQPPFPEQEQEPPGREADMEPLADHGEDHDPFQRNDNDGEVYEVKIVAGP